MARDAGRTRGLAAAALCLAALTGLRADEPTGCAFGGTTYSVGERWVTGPPDTCAKYLCEGDGQIASLTCPWFVAPVGCAMTPGDEQKVYPGCCPQPKCHHPDKDAVVNNKLNAKVLHEDGDGGGSADAATMTASTSEAILTASTGGTVPIITATMTALS